LIDPAGEGFKQMTQQMLPPMCRGFKGSYCARWILARFGWRVLFDGLPGPRGVIAVYPHTSNWDFPIGLFAKWALGIPARYWGKDSLFRSPAIGWFMRWSGGIPVNRTSQTGMVTDTVAAMHAADFFWLGVAPEGTRKRIAGLRSGFYRVACEAGVPLGVAYFDYASKTVDVRYFFMPTGDEAVDLAHMKSVWGLASGLNPASMSPIQFLDKAVARDSALVNEGALL
jgi:1-acyl-sn-glycerol-3-phosphate acyltransferase